MIKVEVAEKKCLKKTTSQQFCALVRELEANPELARGAPVFGRNKPKVEEKWKCIARIVNSYGPPQRSAVEWKKIWADLKSRTKKKIAENENNIRSTGDGTSRYSALSELEQAIDRISSLSATAAPSRVVLGIRSMHRSSATTTVQHAILREMQRTNQFHEAHANALKMQVEASKAVAEAVESQAVAAKQLAEAASIQAEATKTIAQTISEIVRLLTKNQEA